MGTRRERLRDALVQLLKRQPPGREVIAKLGGGGIALGVADPHRLLGRTVRSPAGRAPLSRLIPSSRAFPVS